MSVPLGGFSFSVDVITQQGQANLAALAKAAQQAGAAVTAAFAAAQPQINTQAAQQQLTQLAQTGKAAQAAVASIRVNVQADNAEATARDLEKLNQSARALSSSGGVNLSITAHGEQATAEIQRFEALIKAAGAGDNLTLNLKANPAQALAALAKLDAEVKAAAARGAVINITANTAQAEKSLAGLQQLVSGAVRGAVAGSGIGGNLLIGAGLGGGAIAALAVTIAVQKLTETIVGAVSAGVKYNANLEQTTREFTLLTGSANQAEVLIAKLRTYADVTPFGTRETLEVGQRFATILAGNIELTERYVHLAGQLAATSPDKTLSDAARAIEEFRGGQVNTLAEVFNIPRGQIQAVKDLGLSMEETLKKIIALKGGNEELVQSLGQTAKGQLSTFQSSLEELGRLAAKPLFDVLAKSVAEFNADFEKNKDGWQQAAKDIGSSVGAIAQALVAAAKEVANFTNESVKLFKFADALAQGKSPQEARAAAQPAPQVQQAERKLTEPEQAIQDAGKKQAEQVDQIVTALGREEKGLQNIQRVHQAISAILGEINNKTAQDSALTEQKIRDVDKQLIGKQTQLAQANELIREGQAPVELRAQAAAAQVEISHAKEIISIKQQQRQIVQQIVDAEFQAATNVASRQIEAQRRLLEDLQREIQLRQEARQVALQALQEQVRAAQESRQVTLQALQDEIQARQQARQVALDGLREEARAAQEARQATLQALQDEIRSRRDAVQAAHDQAQADQQAAEAAFQSQERLFDRTHQIDQAKRQDAIAALQEKDRQAQQQSQTGQSPAEKELKAFEALAAEQQRARTLAGAERSVLEARTGKERADALQRLHDLKAQQAEERTRAALQEKVDAEKAARDKASQDRQNALAKLQAQAQAEDRKFQREKEARDAAHADQQARIQEDQRNQDRAEKALQRDEDQKVHALEEANKKADLADQAKIRAQEKLDQEQKRVEDAQIRAEERANQAADRADQQKLRDAEKLNRDQTRQEQDQVRTAEQNIRTQERGQQDLAAAHQAKADQDRIRDLTEIAGLAQQELYWRLKILEAEDPKKIAAGTGWKVVVEDAIADLEFVRTLLGLQLEGIKLEGANAAAPYLLIQQRLQAAEGFANLTISDLKLQKTAADEAATKIREMADNMRTTAEQAERARDALHTAATEKPVLGPPVPPAFDITHQTFTGGVGPNLDGAGWMVSVGKQLAQWFYDSVTKAMQDKFGDPGLQQQIEGAAAGIGQAAAQAFDSGLVTGVGKFFQPTAFAAELDQNFGDAVDGADVGGVVAASVSASMTESGPAISGALAAPFDQFFGQEGAGAQLTVQSAQLALDLANAFGNAWAASDLAHRFEAPFIEVTDQYFPAALPKFRAFGVDAADQFMEGFTAPPTIETRVDAVFTSVLNNLAALNNPFKLMGENAAQSWCNGWEVTMAGCKCSTCAGRTAGGTPPGPTGAPSPDQCSETRRVPVGNGETELWCLHGGRWSQVGLQPTQPGDRDRRPTSGGNPGPPGLASGGPMEANQTYLIHQAEIVTPRSAHSVLPASVLRGIEHLADLGARPSSYSSAVSHRGGDVHLTVQQTVNSQPGHDPQQIAKLSAEMVVGAVIDALDQAERSSPVRLRRTLPGAL